MISETIGILMKRIIAALACAVLLSATLTLVAEDTSKKTEAVTVEDGVLGYALSEMLRQLHFTQRQMDDTISARAYSMYLKYLDYTKQYLLQEDVDKLSKYELVLDDQLRQGNLAFFSLSQELLNKRYEQAHQYYGEILAKPFDFNKKETIETDPKKLTYCTTLDELKERWRKRLKLQTLNRYISQKEKQDKKVEKATEDGTLDDVEVLSDAELEADAREAIKKNMDTRVRRISQEDKEDRLARYLNAFAKSFGPHTQFFPPQEKENFDIDMTGQLEGIGAMLAEEDGYIKVTEIVPGSASWKQGELKADDLILKVAQASEEPVDIVNATMKEAIKLIRGPKGTEVRLTVQKPDGSVLEIPIIRDVVKVEETYARSALIENKDADKTFGYIYLPKFYSDFRNEGAPTSAGDVRREVEALKARGANGIILDLRNNGGGSLSDAVEMSGLFIEKGPIVQVKDPQRPAQVLKDRDHAQVYDGPLVVLINEFSASASEILAGALQDYDRAIIVGSESSFGKGTVQTFMPVARAFPADHAKNKDYGSLKFTFQQFYRINGASTQYKGVESDIVLPTAYSYRDIGVKHMDHTIPFDSIRPLTYQTYNRGDVASLRAKSQARIDTTKAFVELQKFVDFLEEQQENSIAYLSYEDMQADRELRKQYTDAYNDLDTSHPYLSIEVVNYGQQLTEDQQQRAEDWIAQINKDIYISEAVNILLDIQTPVK